MFKVWGLALRLRRLTVDTFGIWDLKIIETK